MPLCNPHPSAIIFEIPPHLEFRTIFYRRYFLLFMIPTKPPPYAMVLAPFLSRLGVTCFSKGIKVKVE